MRNTKFKTFYLLIVVCLPVLGWAQQSEKEGADTTIASEVWVPDQGNGVWAPSIRHHDGWYYIYWGDPDRGIYRVRTQDPYGDWSVPVLVKKAYSNIDPCPLWDDNGKIVGLEPK